MSDQLQENDPYIPILRIAREAILLDHTGLAYSISKMIEVINGYDWIARGEWGSYDPSERTVETLQKEISSCFDELIKIGKFGLKNSGKRSFAWTNEIDSKIATARNTRHESVEITSLLIDAMRYIDNPGLSITDEICEVVKHPIDPTDENHRGFCRRKRYPKNEGEEALDV